jgi:predicted deacetylase
MANYVLRFDDICPTMNHARWKQFEVLMRRFSIRPIVAVVPNNNDPMLVVDSEDPEFWDRMRSLQQDGWTIALHGWRHDCHSYGKSLVPLHHCSEFAGLPEDEQARMLYNGLNILRSHGLNPEVWVAPRHGFDRSTLSGLKKVGINIVSDGYSRFPFVDDRLLWIPQQLWSGRQMPSGVWTVCVHANTVNDERFRSLESFVEQHSAEFVGVKDICLSWGNRPKHLSDTLHSILWLWKIRTKNLVRNSLRHLKGSERLPSNTSM